QLSGCLRVAGLLVTAFQRAAVAENHVLVCELLRGRGEPRGEFSLFKTCRAGGSAQILERSGPRGAVPKLSQRSTGIAKIQMTGPAIGGKVGVALHLEFAGGRGEG